MDLQKIKDRLDGYQLVDVRDQDEWDTGHAPGATHIPLGELAERIDMLESGKPLLLVCRTGKRSQRGVDMIVDRGLTVESLDGGMTAWAAEGLPMVGADGAPGRVLEPQAEPEYLPPDQAETRDNFMEVIFGLQERYGNREPTDEEAKEFMREWLTKKGKSPEEIERTLSDG